MEMTILSLLQANRSNKQPPCLFVARGSRSFLFRNRLWKTTAKEQSKARWDLQLIASLSLSQMTIMLGTARANGILLWMIWFSVYFPGAHNGDFSIHLYQAADKLNICISWQYLLWTEASDYKNMQ